MKKTLTKRQLQIIDAAGKILATSGVSGLTIKNIAFEMKFTESAFYRHFKSKEEIIVTLLNYLAEGMDERFSAIIKPKMSTEQKFRIIFKDLFLFFHEYSHFAVVIFSDGLMEKSLIINETIAEIRGVMAKHLLPVIIEGKENNSFVEAINAKDLMLIVMGAVRLVVLMWRVEHFEFNIVDRGEELVNNLLILIKK